MSEHATTPAGQTTPLRRDGNAHYYNQINPPTTHFIEQTVAVHLRLSTTAPTGSSTAPASTATRSTAPTAISAPPTPGMRLQPAQGMHPAPRPRRHSAATHRRRTAHDARRRPRRTRRAHHRRTSQQLGRAHPHRRRARPPLRSDPALLDPRRHRHHRRQLGLKLSTTGPVTHPRVTGPPFLRSTARSSPSGALGERPISVTPHLSTCQQPPSLTAGPRARSTHTRAELHRPSGPFRPANSPKALARLARARRNPAPSRRGLCGVDLPHPTVHDAAALTGAPPVTNSEDPPCLTLRQDRRTHHRRHLRHRPVLRHRRRRTDYSDDGGLSTSAPPAPSALQLGDAAHDVAAPAAPAHRRQ